ncbi:MAG: hypothetical protein OXH69_19950 [Acidobacteria bacterium]|nr:hypothetical protein [Acidobacteriota bacterium]
MSVFCGQASPASPIYEVVELLLTLAVPRGDVKPQAKALISTFDGKMGAAVVADGLTSSTG